MRIGFPAVPLLCAVVGGLLGTPAALVAQCAEPLAPQELPAPPEAATPAPVSPAHPERLLGVLPNYRSADGSQPFSPLTAKRKFYIGYKDTTDYPIFLVTGFFATISHAHGVNPEYGGGVAGLAKRYGSAYADQWMGTFFTESVFPVLFREDPRYFRRGTGSATSRTMYALPRVLVTRTDAGHARFNFSEFAGNGSMVAISSSYDPSIRSAASGAQKFAVNVAADALGNVLKEFWPDLKAKYLQRRAKPVAPASGR